MKRPIHILHNLMMMIILFKTSLSQLNQKKIDEHILIDKLLNDYEPAARPVVNAGQSVSVKFSISLIQIYDMVFEQFNKT